MNTRVLLFPVALSAIACGETSINDPRVKECRDRIQSALVITSRGDTVQVDLITHPDSGTCRKAA